MKLKIVFLVSIIIVLSLSACSDSQESNSTIETTTEDMSELKEPNLTTPDGTVIAFFNAFKTNYFETMNTYLAEGTVPFNSSSVTKTQTTNAAVDAMTKNIEYKIKNTQIADGGIEASVEVEITNVSMSSIISDIMEDITSKFPSMSDEEKQNLNIDEMTANQIVERTSEKNSPKKIISTININLIKSNENWNIVATEELYDAMTGDYVSLQKSWESFLDDADSSKPKS